MDYTIKQLMDSTRQYSPKRVDNLPNIRFETIETHTFNEGGFLRGLVKRFVSMFTKRQSVIVRSIAKSATNPEEKYEAVIVARDVKASGDELLEPIIMDKTPVRVRCDCQDFRWRFAPYNHEHGCLFGPKPAPYEKKTDRPPVNPDHIPGMCKHLLNAVEALKSKSLVQ